MWSEILAQGQALDPKVLKTPSTWLELVLIVHPNCRRAVCRVMLTSNTFSPESARPTAVEVDVVVFRHRLSSE